MSESITTINREAGDKAKGSRLQRLRCASLVFDAIAIAKRPHIYAAVEHKEDVFVKDIGAKRDYLEQDKNYDADTTFTFNSREILNTLVGFCDIWVGYAVHNNEAFLGFYSTTTYGKESNTGHVKKLGLKLPDKPVLELLESKQMDYPELLPCVKAMVMQEYKDQYRGKKGEGYIASLEAYDDEDWKKFLQAIDWKFGQFDESATQTEVLEKIKKCKFFNNTCEGYESNILRNIMDLLDERQTESDPLGKFISSADIELIFMQIGASNLPPKEDDPVHKIWSSLPAPTDKRNLIDKIIAVNPAQSQKAIQLYARKTASSRILQDDKVNDKSFLSLRYRIYEKCEQELVMYLQNLPVGGLASDVGVENLFGHLYLIAKNHVADIAKDFRYSLTSDVVIQGIILELFDSCYLALN